MNSEKQTDPQTQFPSTCEGYDSLLSDTEAYRFRLDELSPVLFSDKSQFKTCLISLSDDKYREFRPLEEFEDEQKYLDAIENAKNKPMQIISFFQTFSLTPLQCTRHAMVETMNRYEVARTFFDVLFKFGDQPQVFEESSGLSCIRPETDGSFELWYQLVYVEPNGKDPPKDPWSVRQTGVHHRFCRSANKSVVILIHPEAVPKAQMRLAVLAESDLGRRALQEHPMNVHLVLLSSYLCHWQACIETLAALVGKIRDRVLVVRHDGQQIKPGMLQELRNLEDKVTMRVAANLRNTMKTLQLLVETNAKLLDGDVGFAKRTATNRVHLLACLERLGSHLRSAEDLERRIQSTIGLLADLLNLGNQAIADQTNSNMLQLTRESVDDNATVRVITVFTLIYLPASFIATLLGTNLFEFGTENSGILKISPSFWIYVCVTIPLTVVTLVIWYLFKKRHNEKRRQEREEQRRIP